MLCGQCQAVNRTGRRFCAVCGVPLSEACPDCGFENEPGEKFCGGCGQPAGTRPAAGATEAITATAASQGERRPVTVLFADIVGFTALSSRLDAEEIHRLLGRFFETVDELVAQFGGSIDKHIGDNVMAVFGAPLAHGDDPARAVRTAVAIHEAMPELSASLGADLRVHIGIASGQVVASDTGSRHHQEYTVTGDTVNLASRLDDMAAPGETLASDTVYRAVEMLVEAEDAGETMVKGLAEPVHVWRLLKLADAPSGGTRLPFVGRQNVLAQFRGILSAGRESGGGQAVLVRGEPGIGKTRLIEEVAALAASEGYGCHKGLVLDFGAGMGQDAITALVRSLLGLPPGADREALSTAARAAVDDDAIEADQNVFLNDLLGLPQPADLNAVYEAMDNETRLAGKRTVLARLIRSASLIRPIALFVEDIHWADGVTLSYLAASAAALADCPAVLVMTSRVEGDPLDNTWRTAAQGVSLTTIDLQPLRRDESIALAGQLLDASNQFALNCIERANGNPLFLEQLLRNGEESKEENVPDSIQSIVMARMDRLDPGDKRALQAASIIGQRFGLDLLRHLLSDGDYDCAALLEHALLRPDGDGYLFGHALIRDTVVASLLKSFRSKLHLRAAEWFAERDAVLFAEHLDLAGDDRAPRAYLEAARAEAAEYRFDRVLDLVARGLRLARDPADRFALICQRGDFLRDLGSVEDSIATFREATELAEDDADASRALIGLASGMRLTDQYDEALAVLDDAEAAATRRNLDLELARIHHLRGNVIFPLGRIEECRKEHGKALELAQRTGNVEFEAASLGGLGDAAYGIARMKTSHNYFQRCMEVCRRHGLSRVEVANRSMVGWTLMFLNELGQAVEEGRAAAETAARLGHLRAEVGGRSCAARALLELGENQEALQELERALVVNTKLGAGRFEPQIMCFRALVLAASGQRTDARMLIEKALPIARKTGIRFMGPYILGCLAHHIEDPAARKAALAEAEDILGKGAVGHNALWFYPEAVQGALDNAEWDEALRFATALEDFTSAEPLPWSDFFIARARALSANGKGVRNDQMAVELARLREVAMVAGLRTSLPAIEEALAQQQAAE